MRVFVTGGSGWIGSATVPELVEAGHQVVGLARSEEAAVRLEKAGAEVVRGTLEDLDLLGAAAGGADAVVHLGFVHDFTRYDECVAVDRAAIETMGSALEGTERPFLFASGVFGRVNGPLLSEHDPFTSDVPRAANAEVALGFAERGVRVIAVRLPPTVHGDGDLHGFVPTLVAIARRTGRSAYIGEGTNRWPAVHCLDAGRLFRLALEKAPAGSVLHAVHDEGVATLTIAEAIGRRLGLPVTSVSPEDATDHFGWMRLFFSLGLPASSTFTQQLLGWRPVHVGLLDDLALDHYFAVTAP